MKSDINNSVKLWMAARRRSVTLQAQLDICQAKNKALEQENAKLREAFDRLESLSIERGITQCSN